MLGRLHLGPERARCVRDRAFPFLLPFLSLGSRLESSRGVVWCGVEFWRSGLVGISVAYATAVVEKRAGSPDMYNLCPSGVLQRLTNKIGNQI